MIKRVNKGQTREEDSRKEEDIEENVGVRNVGISGGGGVVGAACCVSEAFGLTVSAFNVHCFIMLS